MCKFSDRSAEPQPPSYFANFLTTAGLGMGGVADYYNDQSGGRISLSGSVVQGLEWTRDSGAATTAAEASRSRKLGTCSSMALTISHICGSSSTTRIRLRLIAR